MTVSPDVSPKHAARYFDGLSAESRPATAWVAAAGVWIQQEGTGPRCWPFAELVLMRGGGSEPVQLERRASPVEVLVVNESAFLSELRAQMPRGTRLSGERGLPGWKGFLGLALMGAVLLFALYRFGIPALADYAAGQMPVEWEREYGRGVVTDMVPEAKRVTSPVIVAPVRKAYAALATSAGLDAGGEQIIVWREPMPNAFAAPGGTVVVTTGLLGILEDPDQMAAVIAHEIGHVEHRHVMRSAFRQLSLGILVGLIAGDQSALSGGLRTAGQLGGLSYSREHEREADDAALPLLAEHATGKEALVGALHQLKAATESRTGSLPGFLSTHPAPADRIACIRASSVAPASSGSAPWRDAAAWRALKAAVAAGC